MSKKFIVQLVRKVVECPTGGGFIETMEPAEGILTCNFDNEKWFDPGSDCLGEGQVLTGQWLIIKAKEIK